MDEDDFDFVPGSSKLSSLFGTTKTTDATNSSFVYTAPRQPKNDSPKHDKAGSVTETSADHGKLDLIFAYSCISYKLENGAYNSVGRTGVAILGSFKFRHYQLVLYKSNKEHLSKSKITKHFTVTVFDNSLAISFYDDASQNWSVMFEKEQDHNNFLQHIAISRYNSSAETQGEILSQDITPKSSDQEQVKGPIELVYTCYVITSDTVTLHCPASQTIRVEPKSSDNSWENCLSTCNKNKKTFVIIPANKKGPCSKSSQSDSPLLLKIEVTNLNPEEKKAPQPEIALLPRNESPESAIESSTEDSSIRARGASIKEALTSTSKSHKANLISRMARMGQATLPLKSNVPVTASDSEEDSSINISPKPRLPRSKALSAAQSQNTVKTVHPQEQSLLVYQSDPMLQHQYLRNIPVVPSPIVSPMSDPSMSVYLSESRTQGTELRMGITKVTDKVDLVLNKLDKLTLDQERQHRPIMSSPLDPGGILTSIQNLVSENSQLKEKVEEQRTKIESQNERIFNLLELNHKFLEENSHSKDKQNKIETFRTDEISSLKSDKAKLETDLSKTKDEVKDLESKLQNLSVKNMEQEVTIKEVGLKNDKCHKELVVTQDALSVKELRISELEKEVDKLRNTYSDQPHNKSNLEESKKQNESLLLLVENGQKEIITLRSKNEELENLVTNFKNQSVSDRTEEVQELSQLLEKTKSEVVTIKLQNRELEELVKSLKSQAAASKSSGSVEEYEELQKTLKAVVEENNNLKKNQNQVNNGDNVVEEVKKVMNAVYRNLQVQFAIGESYLDTDIKKIMASTIRDVTLNYLESKEKSVNNENVSSPKNTATSVNQIKDETQQRESTEPPQLTPSQQSLETSQKLEVRNEEVKVVPKGPVRPTQLLTSGDSLKSKQEPDNNVINTSQPVSPYQQMWSSSQPPPLPLLDDEDEEDDWLS